MQTLIKIIVATALSIPLLGCANTPSSKDTPQSVQNALQATPANPLPDYPWHDGSKGGFFGVGNGWSIEILHAEYKSVVETYVSSEQRELTLIPAKYEWIKDETVGPQGEPEMARQLVTIPATYMTVTESIVMAPAKIEYDLTEPIFNADRTLKTPAIVNQRHVKAVIEQKDRRVVDKPKQTLERILGQLKWQPFYVKSKQDPRSSFFSINAAGYHTHSIATKNSRPLLRV